MPYKPPEEHWQEIQLREWWIERERLEVQIYELYDHVWALPILNATFDQNPRALAQLRLNHLLEKHHQVVTKIFEVIRLVEPVMPTRCIPHEDVEDYTGWRHEHFHTDLHPKPPPNKGPLGRKARPPPPPPPF